MEERRRNSITQEISVTSKLYEHTINDNNNNMHLNNKDLFSNKNI